MIDFKPVIEKDLNFSTFVYIVYKILLYLISSSIIIFLLEINRKLKYYYNVIV